MLTCVFGHNKSNIEKEFLEVYIKYLESLKVYLFNIKSLFQFFI